MSLVKFPGKKSNLDLDNARNLLQELLKWVVIINPLRKYNKQFAQLRFHTMCHMFTLQTATSKSKQCTVPCTFEVISCLRGCGGQLEASSPLTVGPDIFPFRRDRCRRRFLRIQRPRRRPTRSHPTDRPCCDIPRTSSHRNRNGKHYFEASHPPRPSGARVTYGPWSPSIWLACGSFRLTAVLLIIVSGADLEKKTVRPGKRTQRIKLRHRKFSTMSVAGSGYLGVLRVDKTYPHNL